MLMPQPRSTGGRHEPKGNLMPRRARPRYAPAKVTRISHPAAPDDLLPPIRHAWTAFWKSPMSALVEEEADITSLRHLFRLYDERERMMDTIRSTDEDGNSVRLVKGSRGQPRANPLYALVGELETTIRQLEDRFGLSPRARVPLGVSLGASERAEVDSLNDMLGDTVDDDDDRATDFRLAILDGGSR